MLDNIKNLSEKLNQVVNKSSTIITAPVAIKKGSFLNHQGIQYKAQEDIRKNEQILLLDGVAIPSQIANQDNTLSSRTILDRKTRPGIRKISRRSNLSLLFRIERENYTDMMALVRGNTFVKLASYPYNINTLRYHLRKQILPDEIGLNRPVYTFLEEPLPLPSNWGTSLIMTTETGSGLVEPGSQIEDSYEILPLDGTLSFDVTIDSRSSGFFASAVNNLRKDGDSALRLANIQVLGTPMLYGSVAREGWDDVPNSPVSVFNSSTPHSFSVQETFPRRPSVDGDIGGSGLGFDQLSTISAISAIERATALQFRGESIAGSLRNQGGSITGSHSIQNISNITFRPKGYVSRAKNYSYFYIKYLDEDGYPFLDYFKVGNSSGRVEKQTFSYTDTINLDSENDWRSSFMSFLKPLPVGSPNVLSVFSLLTNVEFSKKNDFGEYFNFDISIYETLRNLSNSTRKIQVFKGNNEYKQVLVPTPKTSGNSSDLISIAFLE